MSEFDEKVAAAFAKHDCPMASGCTKPRESVDHTPNIWPCVGCKAPKRLIVDGTICYRSYADYCDD